MTKSERIRELGRQGQAVAEIARTVGVRYQHARNVLLAAGLLPSRPGQKVVPRTKKARQSPSLKSGAKSQLNASRLLEAGFRSAGRWQKSERGGIRVERPLPEAPGVYALASGGIVLYVGLATMGLAKRFHFYHRPGKTQSTSIRINDLIQAALERGEEVEILVAMPANLEWSGLPVSGMAGLELGLIQAYRLEWNIRGAAVR